MSEDSDKIAGQIACLNTEAMLSTLIATNGYHCNVWRSIGGIFADGVRTSLDIVIKKLRMPCSRRDAQLYYDHYRILKNELDDIIPTALFVITQVDGAESVIVIAETVRPWFNIANPANEKEALPLLRTLPKARSQLTRFIAAAKKWRHSAHARVIDLYGLDNLILDIDRNIKYLDSFGVFFNEDLLYLLSDPDEALRERIELSLQRLDYVDYLLRESA